MDIRLKSLPLKSQILLAPAIVIFLIMGLIGFTLGKLFDIKRQNETVREWVSVCEHTQAAISAGERMNDLAAQMQTKSLDQDDDLHFSYLEHSRALTDNLHHPEIERRLAPDTLRYLQEQEQLIRYREQLDPTEVRTAMRQLLPRLEQLYRNFWVQKRLAYTDYYDNVNHITSQLVTVSLYVLAASVFTGIALSAWTIRRTKGRLGVLARNAREICSGNLVTPKAPDRVRDEVDELALCMSTMTQRLLKVVATEKVLEGAEEERKRIAMDMHDQTLSDLTALSRSLHLLGDETLSSEQRQRRLQGIEDELEEIANNIRSIIDDLHPRSLDMLGLENALRSHLERCLAGPKMPAWFLRVDADVDKNLTDFQRLSLYRICLEVVHNIVRHSHGSRYEIDCRQDETGVVLIIEDNGSGFDHDSARRRGGHGLTNIEERAKAIGASTGWSASRFSSGTRFELRLPHRSPLNPLPGQEPR